MYPKQSSSVHCGTCNRLPHIIVAHQIFVFLRLFGHDKLFSPLPSTSFTQRLTQFFLPTLTCIMLSRCFYYVFHFFHARICTTNIELSIIGSAAKSELKFNHTINYTSQISRVFGLLITEIINLSSISKTKNSSFYPRTPNIRMALPNQAHILIPTSIISKQQE